MSQLLIEKIKKARQRTCDVGGFTFTVRRPTDLEMLYLRGTKIREGDLLRDFVVDWNLKEIDLIPGGNPEPTTFETELFMTWIEDQPSMWAPLCMVILEAYSAHEKELVEALGKQEAG